jgi:ketosteroid isomerase-like protein
MAGREGSFMGGPDEDKSLEMRLISLEKRALDRWGKGDPDGFLELAAPDISYFDPYVERRIDGKEALARYYDGARGKVHVDHYDLLNPKVQRCGDMAVLSFNYVSFGGNEDRYPWNCTEVYRREPDGWHIIQTHWSLTRAEK